MTTLPQVAVNCDESYDACCRLARRTARNFYYSFLLLRPVQRRSMCALYAFLRVTDDLGDSDEPPEVRREQIDRWRQSLHVSLAAGPADHVVLPALVDTVQRFEIPVEYLDAVLDGMLMDLEIPRYETFAELETYCYRVASVVGLCCLHIWGFRSREAKSLALPPAEKLGVAFQLTNILRDVQEDFERGRVYLPQADLRQFDYTEADLAAGSYDDRFRALMQFEIDRTRQLYREGLELAEFVHPSGLPCLLVMTRIYYGLLNEIARRQGDVFQGRVRLSRWKKYRIALSSLLWPTSPGRLAAVVK